MRAEAGGNRIAAGWRALAAFALAGLIALAPARAQVEPQVAESLMKRSGLWDQIEGLGPQVRAGLAQSMQQSPRPPSPESMERMGRVADQAFAPAAMRARVLAVLAQTLPAVHVPALDTWLDSARGKRITAIEVESARRPPPADPQAAMRAAVGVYQAASAERRSLIDDYVRVTRSAEVAHEAMVVTAVAVARGVGAANPELPRPSLAELEGFLRGQKAMAMPMLTMAMTANAAANYEPVPDADMRPYVEFLKTDAARSFSEVAVQALMRAIEAAGEEMGRNLRGASDAGRS